MNTLEPMIRIEGHMKPYARHIAANETSLEPNADVVEDLALVVDDSAAEQLVAERVRHPVQKGGLRRRHDDSEVVQRRSGRLIVLNNVESPRVCASGRIRRDLAERIGPFHIKLDGCGRRLARNVPRETQAARIGETKGHWCALPW